jgi:hypothetical protein
MNDPRLFINYRTADTRSAAAGLAKALKREFDPRRIFIDYLGIQGGDTWRTRLLQEVERASVVFVLIGRDWAHGVDPETQQRRLDRPDDWVRQEIECALRRGAKIVPILVDDAPLPAEADLPASLRPIAALQTRPLQTMTAFEADVKRLATLLQGQGFEREVHPWRVTADSVYNRLELDHFVGRGWLTARLDEFLRSYASGFFIVEAQSGLGKTAFLAHLVETRGYIHHFVELQPGAAGIVPGLRNLAAQIVREFGLEPAWIDDLLTGIGTRADFLERLLVVAATGRRASDPPTVIVIDGLDQAGVPDGQNVMGLPARLPEGFYFVLSQRPVEIRLDTSAPRVVVAIDAADPANVRDIGSYVRKWLPDGPAASELVARSQGNWAYAYHVCREIREGDRDANDLDGLPRGLWQYYARFWMQWRRAHEDRWTASHLPLLCTLSAVQERMTLAALAELAEVQDTALYRLLAGEWRPFVTVTPESDGEHFELYHASLRDFVSGTAPLEDLTSGERAFVHELRDSTRTRHRRIAELFLQRWGGTTLETLRHQRDISHRDTYGWRHVVAHLADGEDERRLKDLLTAEWRFVEDVPNLMPGWWGRLLEWTRARKITRLEIPRNAWFESHARAGDLALFLLDWSRAARTADRRHGDGAGVRAPDVVFELAAYLAKSSVRDAAERVPFGVVLALVRCGRWSPEQAIAYARHVADAATRAELLTELATVEAAGPGVIREALEAIDGFTDPGRRATALMRLLETAATDREPVVRKMFAVLRELDAAGVVEHAPPLTAHLTAADWPEYFSLADGLPTALLRLRLLTASAARLQDPSRLHDRLRAAREECQHPLEATSEGDEAERCLTLAILASLTTGDEAIRLADASLASVEQALLDRDAFLDEKPYEALAVIASVFPRKIPGTLLASTLERLLAIRQPRAPTPFDVIASLQGVTTMEQHRSKLAAKLLAIAPRPALRTVEKAVLRTKVRFGDWDAYENLALRYAQLGEAGRALKVVRRIELEPTRQRTLARIAPHLGEPALRRGLAIADGARMRLMRRKTYDSMRHFEAEQARATLVAMTGLLPRLAELGREDEALARLGVLRPASDERPWPQILSGLARHTSERVLDELLRMSFAFQDVEMGAVELMALAPFLPEDKVRALIPASRLIGYSENTVERISWTRVQRSTSGIRYLDLRRSAVHAIAVRLAALGHHQDALRELVVFLRDAARGRSSTDVAECLRELSRLMPAAAWSQALAVAAMHNDQMRAKAVEAVVPLLPGEALDQALAVARSAREEGCRAWGIACLLPLADADRRAPLAREALDHLRAPFWDRSRVLGLLAPHAEEALAEIREDVRAGKEYALASLVHFLPSASSPAAEEMIELADRTYDEGQLLELAEFLPEQRFQKIHRVIHRTPEALYKHDTRLASVSRRMLTSSDPASAFLYALQIRDRYLRMLAIGRISPALHQLPREELLTLWRNASPVSRQSTRRQAFAFVTALAPLVHALGGEEAILQLDETIRATSRWWY